VHAGASATPPNQATSSSHKPLGPTRESCASSRVLPRNALRERACSPFQETPVAGAEKARRRPIDSKARGARVDLPAMVTPGSKGGRCTLDFLGRPLETCIAPRPSPQGPTAASPRRIGTAPNCRVEGHCSILAPLRSGAKPIARPLAGRRPLSPTGGSRRAPKNGTGPRPLLRPQFLRPPSETWSASMPDRESSPAWCREWVARAWRSRQRTAGATSCAKPVLLLIGNESMVIAAQI